MNGVVLFLHSQMAQREVLGNSLLIVNHEIYGLYNPKLMVKLVRIRVINGSGFSIQKTPQVVIQF